MVRIARDRGFLGAGALAIASLAACGSSPLPSGPGTSTLDILGTHEECRSFGGCGWVARLRGPVGPSEAEFVASPDGPGLPLSPGLPLALRDGAYVVTFEQRLLSDAITSGVRDFFISATCSAAITVPGGRSVTHVRVTFEERSSLISSWWEPVQ